MSTNIYFNWNFCHAFSLPPIVAIPNQINYTVKGTHSTTMEVNAILQVIGINLIIKCTQSRTHITQSHTHTHTHT